MQACVFCCCTHTCACHRVAKFNGVHSLDLHFPATFGADQCEIHFVGLKGEYSEVREHCSHASHRSHKLAQLSTPSRQEWWHPHSCVCWHRRLHRQARHASSGID